MTIAPPNLAGVHWVALPVPPTFRLVENWLGSRKRWALYADGEQLHTTVYESRRMAQRHLDAFELGYWRAWIRDEREHQALMAELDAAGA